MNELHFSHASQHKRYTVGFIADLHANPKIEHSISTICVYNLHFTPFGKCTQNMHLPRVRNYNAILYVCYALPHTWQAACFGQEGIATRAHSRLTQPIPWRGRNTAKVKQSTCVSFIIHCFAHIIMY